MDLVELRSLEPRLRSTYEEDKEKAKNIELLAVRLRALRAR